MTTTEFAAAAYEKQGERIREMEIAIFALTIAIPAGIMIFTGSNKKRGCGGGCATCGNRRTCHRRKQG